MTLNDTKLQECETLFQTLPSLPSFFERLQCVSHNNEILICGGYGNHACYSYHTLKNQYKLICSYPNTVYLYGHCVVKRINNSNNNPDIITLLSFGGEHKHVLVMKYKSVWDDTEKNEKVNTMQYNKWIPWTDNFHVSIEIGRKKENYNRARAVIGGSNNHLLFTAYYPNRISVYDLNKYTFIKHHTLPYIISSNNFGYRCFVIKTRNKVSNKKKTEMILFCCNVGLSIEYDEQSKKKYLSIFMYMLMMLSYFLVDIILHLLQKCTDIQ
ncbi:hypothetical protein RFI_29630 [Reticulomyxa filosa]|uniref:Uncharacterized protein n=1 Tax=Reticulomyxa filosa TaxID=46433 RepID=X6M405_RETFI|nr:hypothetical protein RFI_29630 [Reticulomyxa filosa]|eukprot:ETO07760.1 hypothetical protein RFI_29630 [Reticulomyxa filosa]